MTRSEPRAARLLDDIHAALLRQDYAALTDLELALEGELTRPAERPDAVALAAIRARAQRNATTLIAVQRGIRSALRRLSEIRSVTDGMVTYDRNGRHESSSQGRNLATRL